MHTGDEGALLAASELCLPESDDCMQKVFLNTQRWLLEASVLNTYC